MNEPWTSRKFWTMIGWQLAFTGLMYLGKLPVSVYEDFTYLLLGGYFVANVAEKYLIAKANKDV